MKIGNYDLQAPREEVLVLPRNGQDIVIKAGAVLDYSEFEALCPMPVVPRVMKPGKQWIENTNDPKYQKKLQEHGTQRINWMVLKSLEATEGLEWSLVDIKKPETWDQYEQELKDANFNTMEIARIMQTVMTANSLNQDKLDEARDRFFGSQQAGVAGLENSQTEERTNTPSGEPANASV